MAYLDTMNISSTNYALNAFSNLLICSDNITSAKTITFPDGYDFTEGNDMTFRVLFKNGHNCADASTPMTLNGKAVVVNKYGSLIPLPIHNISSTYKCLQPNTVLEMYYNPNYDGNNTPAFVVVGNPVVLSDTNYTIYADGYIIDNPLSITSGGTNATTLVDARINLKVMGLPNYSKRTAIGQSGTTPNRAGWIMAYWEAHNGQKSVTLSGNVFNISTNDSDYNAHSICLPVAPSTTYSFNTAGTYYFIDMLS